MSDRRSDDRRRDRHYSSRRERSRSPDDRRRDRDERSSRRYEDDRRSSRHEEDRDRRGYSERRREEPRTEEARLNEGKKGLNIEIHPLLSKEVDVTNVKSQAVSFIPKSSIATVKVIHISIFLFNYICICRQIKGWLKRFLPSCKSKRKRFQ